MNYYGEERMALKANLHTHTTGSDGKITPQEIIRLYSEAGYDVLSLTDHHQVHDISDYDPRGMILIQGGEIHPENPGRMRWHIVGLGLPADFKCVDPAKTGETAQEVIDAINAAGGIAAVAHPYWCNYSSAVIMPLKNYFAVEIYNSECRYLDKAYSLQTWDELLWEGRRVNAIAVDDTHGPLSLFKGWTVICAAERTREAVMDALRKGEFYASQGPEFRKFALEGDTLAVEFSDAAECCFIAKSGRRCIAKRDPEQLKKGAGIINRAELDLSGMRTGDNFVRCHIRDVQGRHAWSNPIYL